MIVVLVGPLALVLVLVLRVLPVLVRLMSVMGMLGVLSGLGVGLGVDMLSLCLGLVVLLLE